MSSLGQAKDLTRHVKTAAVYFFPDLMPFLWVSFSWLLFGLLFCLVQGQIDAMGWFVGFWFISLCNLFALAKTAHSAVNLASGTKQSGRELTNLFLWGTLKLFCFGVIVGVFIFVRELASSVVVIGVGTVVVVPLFGGFFWLRTEPAGT